MNCSMPGFSVLYYLQEFAQTEVHWVADAIQPSHLLSPPSPPALNLSQHQGLQGIYITIPLCSSARIKAPTQIEDGNFRLSTRFLQHHSVTWSPTDQKKVTHLQPSAQIFPTKTFPWKPSESSGFFEQEHLFSSLGPVINFSGSKLWYFGLSGLTVCWVQELLIDNTIKGKLLLVKICKIRWIESPFFLVYTTWLTWFAAIRWCAGLEEECGVLNLNLERFFHVFFLGPFNLKVFNLKI